MDMLKKAEDTKPNGYNKKCRDCEKPIYLHRGSSGPWRAYEAAVGPEGEPEWVRHRCASALQDAEIMHIIAPAGSKPTDLVPKMKRLIVDFENLIEQAEARLTVTPTA
jgi:hypothetical protein